MAEIMLKIKTGIVPHEDGSGYKVDVTIEKDDAGSEPTVSLDSVWRLPASDWPAVARQVQHLLDAAAQSPQVSADAS